MPTGKTMTTLRKTFESLLANQTKSRKKPAHREHDIQSACVYYFRVQYPQYKLNLFAVPNGGRRDKVSGALLKEEGVIPGVSDLILLMPKGGYHGLLIEMKTKEGSQSLTQKQWQQHVERFGYKYVVCRSVDDFKREVGAYINLR